MGYENVDFDFNNLDEIIYLRSASIYGGLHDWLLGLTGEGFDMYILLYKVEVQK